MGYRILHAIRSVNPAGGGPIEGVKQMSAANQRHGHSIEVASLDAPDDPWVRDCPLRCHALGPAWLPYGYSPRFVPWLRIHRRDYDVVVVNGIWQYSSFGVWRALQGTPTPYFVFTHGMLDPWFKRTYPLKHLKKWLYWPWAEYRVLRDATAVIFTCEEERRLARQSFWLYKCDEFVVNYGTAEPAGDPENQRRLFVEQFPNLADKRCLLFLGRVHVKKGPDLLFKAFADVLSRLPPETTKDVHLVMAGPNDHAYGQKMIRLGQKLGLAERVTWTGMVTGELKWGAFRAADAFILPSHQENFGISVAEALACGVPVLISNQVNIWREIHHDGAGLVETDDLAGTIRLLEGWLTTNPETWRAMKPRARSCFERRFTIEKTANSLMRAFHIYGMMAAQEQVDRP
jgi:glycosyltransferase involved in cell wall biosynthesis